MKFKKIIFLTVFLSLFCLSSMALADSVTITNYGPSSFNALLTTVVNYVSGLIATLAVIMIIISGIMYLTSAGSPERTGAAKKALYYAIAGIAIALAASGIVATINAIL